MTDFDQRLDDLADRLAKPVVFHCSGVEVASARRDVETMHTLGPPGVDILRPDVPGLYEWIPPSQRALLERFGPIRLFMPATDAEDGFELLSIEQ